MTSIYKVIRPIILMMILVLVGQQCAFGAPKPPMSSVTWTGNGTSYDGMSRSLITEICSPTIGASAEGNYLRFVLASTKSFASNPYIKFGSSGTEIRMIKSNNDKKGTSSYYYVLKNDGAINLQNLLESGVYALNFGSAAPTLTISHGCNQQSQASCGADPFNGITNLATNIGNVGGEVLIEPTLIDGSNSKSLSNFISGIWGSPSSAGSTITYLASLGCLSFTASFGSFVSLNSTNVIFTQNMSTAASGTFNITDYWINPTFYGASIPVAFKSPVGNFIYPDVYPNVRVNFIGISGFQDAESVVYTLKFYPFSGETGVPNVYSFSYQGA